jgi:ankyrin repeat protein
MNKRWLKRATLIAAMVNILLLGACSREYTTEMMNAAKDGNLQAVQAAAQRGGDVKQRSNKGKNALMFAASENHLDVAKWLVEQGVDVNEADDFGTTALIVAATAGHHDVVKLLLDSGAKAKVRDETGGAPLVNAVYFGHEETVQLLLDNMLQAYGPGLEKRDGEELLMLGAGLGHANIVGLMVEAGIDVNGRGLKRRTPLMAAAAFNRPEVAKVLLAQGADPAARDEDGQTALSVAKEKGSDQVVALLTGMQ